LPIQEIMSAYIAKGGDIFQLVEPCDGFHPG